MSTAKVAKTVVKNVVEVTHQGNVIDIPITITRNVAKGVAFITQQNFVVSMILDTGPLRGILLKAQLVLGKNPQRILIYFKQKYHSQKTSGKSQSAKYIQY